MNLRLADLALLLALSLQIPATRAVAEDPPAPVVVDESAEPIQAGEADETSPATQEQPKEESKPKTETPPAATDADAPSAQNAGLEDLDKAAQLKVTAENLPDLNDVVDKLDSAMEKGLDKDNQEFADQLLISALLQRATVLSAAVLDRPLVDPRRDPRWMQVRQFAVNDLQRVLSLDDKIWEAHLLMGRLQALPMGDAKTAKRELTKVIDASEATPEDRAQALALRGTLQTDEAKRGADFDEAIKLLPDKPDYYRVRAQYRYGQDKYDEALVDIDKALELEPDHPATIELRGLILLGLKKYDEALAAFSKASELAPEAVLPHQHLGEVYRQQGNLKKSAEQLTKALELEPNDPATLLLRANVYNQLEEPDAALKDVDAAIKAQPQLLVAHLLQAEILASENRIDEAIANLEKLLPLAPNQPRLLEPLATFYLVGGYPRKSIETFTKILAQEPENYRALRFRGDANLNIGKHAEAVADFDAALKLNGEDEGLLNNFAWVLATSPDDKVRDGKRSIELATKAADLSSYNTPHILSTLAAAYAETGDFENSKKWSAKSIEISQQEIDAAKDEEERKRLEATNVDLKKELANYEAGKPTREKQEQEEKQPTTSTTDHTATKVERSENTIPEEGAKEPAGGSPKSEEQVENKTSSPDR
jgi:tetratricopeptide (TPR) repeat protein